MQRKHKVFDFTGNLSQNLATLQPNKYSKETLKFLTQNKNHEMTQSLNFKARNPSNIENVIMQANRNSRNNKLVTRYNIITNQYQTYKQ